MSDTPIPPTVIIGTDVMEQWILKLVGCDPEKIRRVCIVMQAMVDMAHKRKPDAV